MNVMDPVNNFRDLGGISCSGNLYFRQGLIYRSAKPEKFSLRDEKLFHSLKIKTLIDLRPEIEQNIDHLLLPGQQHITFPVDITPRVKEKIKPLLMDRNSSMEITKVFLDLYEEMVFLFHPFLKDIFTLLSVKENYPVLIH